MVVVVVVVVVLVLVVVVVGWWWGGGGGGGVILGEVKARPKDIISFSLDYISKSKVQTSNPSSSPISLDTPARPADSHIIMSAKLQSILDVMTLQISTYKCIISFPAPFTHQQCKNKCFVHKRSLMSLHTIHGYVSNFLVP